MLREQRIHLRIIVPCKSGPGQRGKRIRIFNQLAVIGSSRRSRAGGWKRHASRAARRPTRVCSRRRPAWRQERAIGGAAAETPTLKWPQRMARQDARREMDALQGPSAALVSVSQPGSIVVMRMVWLTCAAPDGRSGCPKMVTIKYDDLDLGNNLALPFAAEQLPHR